MPDRCPPTAAAQAALDPASDQGQSWLRHLIERGVAITSTLTVFETMVPGLPMATGGALEAMHPDSRRQYQGQRERIARDTSGRAQRTFRAMRAQEREFARLGGRLVAGTDPTGYGGVVAGYTNQRQVELLGESGFIPVEAIRIVTHIILFHDLGN